jgi:hypothetical protein
MAVFRYGSSLFGGGIIAMRPARLPASNRPQMNIPASLAFRQILARTVTAKTNGTARYDNLARVL